jgi:hypothetical protein
LRDEIINDSEPYNDRAMDNVHFVEQTPQKKKVGVVNPSTTVRVNKTLDLFIDKEFNLKR